MITHSRETYQPTSIMRWDRGIFNGSIVLQPMKPILRERANGAAGGSRLGVGKSQVEADQLCDVLSLLIDAISNYVILWARHLGYLGMVEGWSFQKSSTLVSDFCEDFESLFWSEHPENSPAAPLPSTCWPIGTVSNAPRLYATSFISHSNCVSNCCRTYDFHRFCLDKPRNIK